MLSWPVSTFAREVELSVGFAEVDVSPVIGEKPVFMAGFGQDRKATKVHDPIIARAIVLSDGSKKVGMVCVDVVGLFYPSVERVRSQVQGLDYVLVSATHNHEAPDTLGLWGSNPFKSGVDPDYLKKVESGAAQALKTAAKNLKPARARIGSAKGPELLHDGRKPQILHDDLIALRFEALDAKPGQSPLGILIEWNVHPELLGDKNTEVSADHVGYTVDHLKKKYACPVAYFTGTVGGLMTNLHVPLKNAKGEELKDGTFEKTEAYGIAVGKLAEKALAQVVDITLTPFDIRTQQILVPVENPLYKLAGQAGVLNRAMYEYGDTPTPKDFVPAKDLTKSVGIKSEVGYLKLGELDVALIPGEIYPELVLGKVQDPVDPGADFPDAPIEPSIYGKLPGKHRMLIGLANDEIGYIIPKRQWDVKAPFCYGLKKAQYGEVNSCGANVGPVICEVFNKLVVGR
jgi:hypothetical protein